MLLAVAHGSRDPRHAATIHALLDQVRRQRPQTRVEVGFLDFDTPSLDDALDRLAARHTRRVVAVPLLLGRAYHATDDIPGVLDGARARHHRMAIRQADVLGPSPLLLDALEERLRQAGAPTGDPRLGVVLASAGCSDPAVRARMSALAAEWRTRAGWHSVLPAYASAAGPRVPEAVAALRAAGARRVAVARYFLAPGRLPDIARDGAAAAGADIVGDVLGPSPAVARLLLHRHTRALAAPWPAVPTQGQPRRARAASR
ncbi:sirohydrochlorin chelatase [Allostreptomyces psammosilenae]|uniref:sirohydrochlorin chelatase n=1 Tax=Allostreptomyces psammosilenae TaxID=1892865 RepID=UPI0015C8958B|nr:CbiX/SirB N-terminal domain-containing protein [Allostreptomyces psammosilenae]